MPRISRHIVIDMTAPAEGAPAPSAGIAWMDQALFYGMIAIVMFGPLAFGTTQSWSEFVQRTAALGLVGLWMAKQYLNRFIEVACSPVYLPSLIFFSLVALQFVTGMSGYRYATLTEGLNLIPFGILIFIAGETFTRRRKLHQAVLTLSVFGFALAIFALVQDLSGATKIYWLMPVTGVSVAMYGPYANHNHFAGVMEMLVPLTGAAAFLERGAKRGLLLFASVIMALSIVFSRSRGGMLGLAVAVIFVCAILLRTNRHYRAAFTVAAVAAAVVVLVLLLGNDRILQRLTETQDNYRLAIYRDCIRMWLHKPLFGFGFGTFPSIYPQYRSFFTNLFVNHAHNDYLELLVEMGVTGAAVVAWFLFEVFRQGFRKIFDRYDEQGSVLTIGVLAGIAALLAHSALDFNLHIAGNAALFYVLCSAAATPFRHRVRPAEFESESDVEAVMVESPA